MVRLVVSLAFATTACGRIGFDAVSGDAAGPGDDAPVVPACATWGPFSTPQIIPALVSSATDWAPSVSKDGLRMLFSSARAGTQDLYVSTRSSTVDEWGAPTVVEGFDTASNQEDDPTISDDQLEIYFGKNALFRATRSDADVPFGVPVEIVPGSVQFELVQGAELSSDELRLYFSAGATESELFVMERASRAANFTTFVSLGIPSGADMGYPTISTDERELIVSQAVTGPQDRDLFVATRATVGDEFPPPTAIPELASDDEDWDPELSFDGTTLWFASTRPPAQAQDIFVTTRVCLD